ncbi:MAG TPA: hypothetical protein VEY09_14970 [Pyrinomonadaceae bacterium]|nr:hypothetical protein [Pyrinomonadaceae bacterium]
MADERNEKMTTTDEGAGQPALLTYAVLAGLTPLIPVPLLDDAAKGYFRRRLVRSLAASRGRALAPGEIEALTAERSGGCLGGCVGTLLVYPLKKVFSKIFFFLEWKRAVDLTSRTYHFGYLVGYALRPRAAGASALDLRGARAIGEAIEAVCLEAPLKPVEGAVSAAFSGSRKVLRASAAVLGHSLRRLAGRRDRAEVERAIHEVEPAEKREVAPIVARLQSSLASVPDEHFRRLRSMLDAHLQLPRDE